MTIRFIPVVLSQEMSSFVSILDIHFVLVVMIVVCGVLSRFREFD